MTPGGQYWGVWSYWHSRNGHVTERVAIVCATKEQAITAAAERMRNEIADDSVPLDEHERLFVREVYVQGLVPG